MFVYGSTPAAPAPRSSRDAGWLPQDPTRLHLVEVGQDFDVVRTPRTLAAKVWAVLEPHRPSCVEDIVTGAFLWLVPVGRARRWPLHPDQHAAVLARGWHVSIPGENCVERRRWIGPGPALTPADLLEAALDSLTHSRPPPSEPARAPKTCNAACASAPCK
ncbi:hypothetical protein [Kitasatospora sp. NPDC057015]|uniref:hypothetical protein n=1 Tax=Kitasatospora sp. NPDC057015 TaxID=3346001 RepID=UPI00362B7EBD